MIKKLEKRVDFISCLVPVADKSDVHKMILVIKKLQDEIINLKRGRTNEKNIQSWLESVDNFLSIEYLENKYLNDIEHG